MEGIVKREKLTLSVPEAAQIVGVSQSKMYEIVKIKGFPTIQIGRRLLVSAKGLERWIEEQAEKGWYA
ncbi:MAG: helix-turn-helix domain-containing protein [Candidatus Faecousia sp.]|nr:helix-turn-helix domain-containing protein [Candidatus Faecousia sp.]